MVTTASTKEKSKTKVAVLYCQRCGGRAFYRFSGYGLNRELACLNCGRDSMRTRFTTIKPKINNGNSKNSVKSFAIFEAKHLTNRERHTLQ